MNTRSAVTLREDSNSLKISVGERAVAFDLFIIQESGTFRFYVNLSMYLIEKEYLIENTQSLRKLFPKR